MDEWEGRSAREEIEQEWVKEMLSKATTEEEGGGGQTDERRLADRSLQTEAVI